MTAYFGTACELMLSSMGQDLPATSLLQGIVLNPIGFSLQAETSLRNLAELNMVNPLCARTTCVDATSSYS